jgi:hypothetical protein
MLQLLVDFIQVNPITDTTTKRRHFHSFTITSFHEETDLRNISPVVTTTLGYLSINPIGEKIACTSGLIQKVTGNLLVLGEDNIETFTAGKRSSEWRISL